MDEDPWVRVVSLAGRTRSGVGKDRKICEKNVGVHVWVLKARMLASVRIEGGQNSRFQAEVIGKKHGHGENSTARECSGENGTRARARGLCPSENACGW